MLVLILLSINIYPTLSLKVNFSSNVDFSYINELRTDFNNKFCNKIWNVIGSIPTEAIFPFNLHGIDVDKGNYNAFIECRDTKKILHLVEFCEIQIKCKGFHANDTKSNKFSVMISDDINESLFKIVNADLNNSDICPDYRTKNLWNADIRSIDVRGWCLVGWRTDELSLVVFASPNVTKPDEIEALTMLAYKEVCKLYKINLNENERRSTMKINSNEDAKECEVQNITDEELKEYCVESSKFQEKFQDDSFRTFEFLLTIFVVLIILILFFIIMIIMNKY